MKFIQTPESAILHLNATWFVVRDMDATESQKSMIGKIKNDDLSFFDRVESSIKEIVTKKNRNPEKPHKHHFVPRSYQKRFQGDADFLWGYIFSSKRICPVDPMRIGWLRDLYALPNEDDTQDFQVEHFFSVIEDKSAPGIERLLRGEDITEEERFWLCFFWGAAFCRSHDMIRSYQSISAKLHEQEIRDRHSSIEAVRCLLAENPSAEGISAEELFDFVHSDEYEVVYEPHSVLPAILRMMPMICHLLWQSGINVLQAPEGKSFVSGDSPVVLLPRDSHRSPGGFGSSARAMPLSRDVCLISTPKKSGIHRYAASRDDVRNLNLLVAHSAHELIIGRSQRLISSLVDATNARNRVWSPLFHVTRRELNKLNGTGTL
ncbi:DUF4238 domain-containing protein [Ralstonia pseudosolanacearum]